MPDFTSLGPQSRISVLGAGSWGTALASLLAANGHAVCLWARDPVLVEALLAVRENRRYLPGIALADAILPTDSLELALASAEVVVFAVPSGAMREVAQETVPFLPADALLLSAAKGLEGGTGLRMSEALAEVFPEAEARTVVLSGPNLALEAARGLPTASVAASLNPTAAHAV